MKTIIQLLISLVILFPKAIGCENAFFSGNDYKVNGAALGETRHAEALKIFELLKNNYNSHLIPIGKELHIKVDYTQQRLNAFATRDDANNPVIKVTSGLLAHPKMNNPALTVVLCHEIGHYLGGAPKKLRGRSSKRSWSSAEGQADYYATAVCLKNIMLAGQGLLLQPEKFQNNSTMALQIERICKNGNCEALASAIYQVAKIYAEIKGESSELSLIKSDPFQTYRTILDYPSTQCRLDTMLSGLLCPDILSIGYEANTWCSDERFQRPDCWFNPNR